MVIFYSCSCRPKPHLLCSVEYKKIDILKNVSVLCPYNESCFSKRVCVLQIEQSHTGLEHEGNIIWCTNMILHEQTSAVWSVKLIDSSCSAARERPHAFIFQQFYLCFVQNHIQYLKPWRARPAGFHRHHERWRRIQASSRNVIYYSNYKCCLCISENNGIMFLRRHLRPASTYVKTKIGGE